MFRSREILWCVTLLWANCCCHKKTFSCRSFKMSEFSQNIFIDSSSENIQFFQRNCPFPIQVINVKYVTRANMDTTYLRKNELTGTELSIFLNAEHLNTLNFTDLWTTWVERFHLCNIIILGNTSETFEPIKDSMARFCYHPALVWSTWAKEEGIRKLRDCKDEDDGKKKTWRVNFLALIPYVIPEPVLSGIDIEVIKIVAKKMDADLQFIPGKRPAGYNPENNEWLGMMGAVHTT